MFYAGSLSMPFDAMEKAFEAKYPKVDLQKEAAGSQACARKITDLKKPCDIMASADYKVIDKLLIPDYADWNVRFASNQLVLCYTEKSKHADQVNKDNWFEILQKKGVIWGHSDPNLDPCGYRALMVIQLAEKFYKKPGLYEAAIANRPEKISRSLGAPMMSTFLRITFPLAWRSMLIGLIMCSARALSEFGAVVVVAYHPMTAPVLIYERFEGYGLKYSQPVAVWLVLVCLALFFVLRILTLRKPKEA